jgi:undecaprenyl-diphosphatase
MSYLDAIVLGVLQGLTEFLPVSSSGHLVLMQAVMNVSDPGVSFEVLVHLGTLLSVIVYFRHKLILLVKSLFQRNLREERLLIAYLAIATVPAGLAGVLLEDFFEQAFSDPSLTSVMLLVTGVFLLLSRFFKSGMRAVGPGSSIIMGVGQALAILPGVSRSGTTIVAGMVSGVKPSTAAEFSFLLAIPAIGGAVILKSRELLSLSGSIGLSYLVGAACAFLTGMLAVGVVLTVIRRGRFEYFAYYCFAVGAVGLYLFL